VGSLSIIVGVWVSRGLDTRGMFRGRWIGKGAVSTGRRGKCGGEDRT
jgi:hypothetical protein